MDPEVRWEKVEIQEPLVNRVQVETEEEKEQGGKEVKLAIQDLRDSLVWKEGQVPLVLQDPRDLQETQ